MTETSQEPKKPEGRTPSAPKTLKYRYIGSHAETLHNGSPLEIGGFADLTEDDLRESHIEMLAHDGTLIGTDEESEHQISLASRRVERRVNNEDGEE